MIYRTIISDVGYSDPFEIPGEYIGTTSLGRWCLSTIIKEERFILKDGCDEYVLRVQQLVSGFESWPKAFRLQLPASAKKGAKTFYGASAKEVVEQVAEYLSGMPVLTGSVASRLAV